MHAVIPICSTGSLQGAAGGFPGVPTYKHVLRNAQLRRQPTKQRNCWHPMTATRLTNKYHSITDVKYCSARLTVLSPMAACAENAVLAVCDPDRCYSDTNLAWTCFSGSQRKQCKGVSSSSASHKGSQNPCSSNSGVIESFVRESQLLPASSLGRYSFSCAQRPATSSQAKRGLHRL